MPIDTSQISAAGLTMPSVNKPTITDTSALDKDAFLKLLAAQAKSQDPMNPTDSTAQIAQLAQFSSLEQMSNIATGIKSLTASINAQGATALVGHSVTYKAADGTDVTGTVTKVTMATEGALLTVDDVDGVKPATLIEVR